VERRITFLHVLIWALFWECQVKALGGKLDVDLVNWVFDEETETLHLNATLQPPPVLDHIKVTLVV
jgi:hypothetical protein